VNVVRIVNLLYAVRIREGSPLHLCIAPGKRGSSPSRCSLPVFWRCVGNPAAAPCFTSPSVVRLWRFLKLALRAFGLRCIGLSEGGTVPGVTTVDHGQRQGNA
jgi:hypothetical protein